ncbi:hypothetical protein WA158_002952 [Blastocystis sp. Blastoise]
MVKKKVESDGSKMGDIHKNVIPYERLIGDLIGTFTKSIGFCIHSGESINELVKLLLRNCERMNDKNGDEKPINIQESSYVPESDFNMNNNDNEIDYIRFTNNGPVYSLPKRITNSLVGTFLYEQCQDGKRTIYGDIYLDYRGDETLVPFLIDSLMNKPINVDQLELKDQIDLLNLFEYCNLPIPEEFVKYPYRYRNNHLVKLYKEGDDVILYIKDEKDEILKEYLKNNGLWNKIVNEYDHGYVDYDAENNEMYLKMNYTYIEYIYEYIKTNHIYISEEEIKAINKELLEKEMVELFGDKGRDEAKEGMISFLFKGSTIILNRSIETPLVNWLGKEKKWKLLFRASEHDYKASEFHRFCDDQGETVTIIKHKGNDNHINIFGGYTNQNWDFRNSLYYKPYSKEFLFTLSNEHGIPPTQYKYADDENCHGIYCHPDFGPVFGDGQDICIYHDPKSEIYSSCNACSYDEINTPQKSSLFVNTKSANKKNFFKEEDYEVWGTDK